VAAQDRDKPTLSPSTGFLWFIRLPCGPVSAPASLERALDIILSIAQWKTCLVYMDNMIIFSRTVDDRIRHFREVLLIVEKACVLLKKSYQCVLPTSHPERVVVEPVNGTYARPSHALATAIARKAAQASVSISLPWLNFMADKCFELYRPPVSCPARLKTRNPLVCESPSPSTVCPLLAHSYQVCVLHCTARLVPASRVRSRLASQVT